MTTQLQKLWIFYYIPNIAQFFLDRYTTTDPVWSFRLESKMLW